MVELTPTEFNRKFFKFARSNLFNSWDYNHFKMELGYLPHLVEIELQRGKMKESAYQYGLGYDIRFINKKTGRVIHSDNFRFKEMIDEIRRKADVNVRYPLIRHPRSMEVVVVWDDFFHDETKPLIIEYVDNYISRLTQKMINWMPKH